MTGQLNMLMSSPAHQSQSAQRDITTLEHFNWEILAILIGDGLRSAQMVARFFLLGAFWNHYSLL